ncbi:Flp pilus assembly ATPase [Alcaligenes faecalis subsp. faecalis NCIB 8687]|nr:Flp pilus assembly ATPase [Alcaligenes faecalis subsp. faecalis NCIB 8687]
MNNTSLLGGRPDLIQVREQAHEHLLARIEELGAEFGRWTRQAIQDFVGIELASFVRLKRVPVNEQEVREIVQALTRELAGLGPLEDLLEDPSVEDILINGHDKLFVSRGGVLQREPSGFTDDQHVLRIVRRILAPLGRRLDESVPMVDARLPDGGRLNVVIHPLAVDGPMVSIRKFRKDPLKPEDLLRLGAFDEPVDRLLQAAVASRCNILISGGTSSGKTSLLNALAFYIPKTERVVTVEDTAELALNHPHVVRLEARQAGFAGFQGSEDSLRRQIASALDFIIQIGRLPNGKRRVLSITEITGMGDGVIAMQELYRHESYVLDDGTEQDRWVSLGIHPHTRKLMQYRDQLANEQVQAQENAPKEGGGFWDWRR